MTNDSILDPAALQNLLTSIGGDRAFLRELIDTYLADSPAQFAALRAARTQDDAEAFRRAAHSLKSNSANMGALELARQCQELEARGKAGILENAEPKIIAAELEFEKVRRALKTE